MVYNINRRFFRRTGSYNCSRRSFIGGRPSSPGSKRHDPTGTIKELLCFSTLKAYYQYVTYYIKRKERGVLYLVFICLLITIHWCYCDYNINYRQNTLICIYLISNALIVNNVFVCDTILITQRNNGRFRSGVDPVNVSYICEQKRKPGN